MKFPLIIAVCAGLIVSGAAQAGEIKLDQRFSGIGTETAVDTNGDGTFATAFSFQMWGSPGRSTSQSLGEFVPAAPNDCPVGALQSDVLLQSFVNMFNDGSMLYFVTTAGHSCVTFVPFEIACDLEGDIVGGTGRFKGATDSWTAECEIFPVGAFSTASTGTMKGTIVVPD
jgi:hypothetical protein